MIMINDQCISYNYVLPGKDGESCSSNGSALSCDLSVRVTESVI